MIEQDLLKLIDDLVKKLCEKNKVFNRKNNAKCK